MIHFRSNRFLMLVSTVLLVFGSFLGTRCVGENGGGFFTLKGQTHFLRSPASIGMGAAAFAGPLAWNALLSSRMMNKHAGDETVAFVREVLKDAGYEQSQIDKTKIFEGDQFASRMGIIYVPFSDELLLRARHYYETKEEISGPDKRRVQIMGCMLRGIYTDLENLTDEELCASLQMTGQIATKDSIPLWRSCIVHEMGHVFHSHDFKRMLFLATMQGLSCAYTLSLMKSSGWWKYPIAVATSINISCAAYFLGRPLWRSLEKQADAEVVRRVQNIEALETMGKTFALDTRLHNVLVPRLRRLFDEHPTGADRARFFHDAAEKLRKQQLTTSHMPPQHSGS